MQHQEVTTMTNGATQHMNRKYQTQLQLQLQHIPQLHPSNSCRIKLALQYNCLLAMSVWCPLSVHGSVWGQSSINLGSVWDDGSMGCKFGVRLGSIWEHVLMDFAKVGDRSGSVI